MTKTINRITREDIQVFRTCVEFDQDARPQGGTLDHYQHIATKSAIYPGRGTALGLAYVALKLNGEAGEFAEHVGKAMRDDDLISVWSKSAMDNNELTPERRTSLIKEIGDVLWYASAACNELGITLSEAAQINLEKLCDRGERDKLRGSGDDR